MLGSLPTSSPDKNKPGQGPQTKVEKQQEPKRSPS